MNILGIVILTVFKILDLVDFFVSLIGIRLCPIHKGYILKDLPEYVRTQTEQPDIKPLADAFFGATEGENFVRLGYRIYLKSWCREILESRLKIQQTFQQKPEILQVPIKKPVFIIGPPRTGTTFLQWLLACDDQFRSPMLWEQLYPCLPGPVEDFECDMRHIKAAKIIAIRKALSSKQFAVHGSEADRPEDDLMLLMRSFFFVTMFGMFQPYDEFCHNLDETTADHMYEFYKKHIQLLGFGHDMNRKFYLGKLPQHLLYLDHLVNTFPDARLIFTYRPLSETVPSCVSFVKHFVEPLGTDTSTDEWLKRLIARQKLLMTRGVRALQRIERENPDVCVYYLSYKDLTTDPLGEIRKMYDSLGLTLTPEADLSMAFYVSNDPKKKLYGKHKYKSIESIDTEYLKEEFKDYISLMSQKVGTTDLI